MSAWELEKVREKERQKKRVNAEKRRQKAQQTDELAFKTPPCFKTET